MVGCELVFFFPPHHASWLMRLTSLPSVPETPCSNVDRDADYLDTLCVAFLTAPKYRWLDATSQSQRTLQLHYLGCQTPYIVQTHQRFRDRLPFHPQGTTPRLETKSVCLNVTRLSAQEDFIEFFSHENFKTNERFLPHTGPSIHSLAISHRTTQRCIITHTGNDVKNSQNKCQ